MKSKPKVSLPEGETDPNLLYNAVGRAIHAWEAMEEAFARLFAAFTGLPEQPDALMEYGSDNRRFVDRMAAIRAAGERYFCLKPSQENEAILQDLLTAAADLSIKRHRIAHGHITMWTEFQLPEAKGPFEVTGQILYRWGAPWYSTGTLRTNPVGVNASTIETDQKAFENLHNRIFKFTSELQS
ncbi:hypothetical protein [Mesorhizobium sp. dw_380]|uniref:hypothetical protein n=1 Tax=Mesorhizobium sp. dw_380 TaxID=2812001 RepID=UPI001BDE35C3|nr:hypothetical protein [Mesorhizobium sp. dw_380]